MEDEHGGELAGKRAGIDVLRAEGALDGAVKVVAEARGGAELGAGAVREAGDAAWVTGRERGYLNGRILNGGDSETEWRTMPAQDAEGLLMQTRDSRDVDR